MPIRNLAWLLVMPSVVLFLSTLTAVAPTPKEDYELIRNVVDVLAEVDKNYYRELTPDEKRKFVEAMLRGGMHELDRHGDFYNAEAMKQFDKDTEGKYGGIGAVLSIDPETWQLMVESTFYGTPAFKAGLQPGDLITKVGDRPTRSEQPLETAEARQARIQEFREFIMGDPGTDVQLTILRTGSKEPETITLTRDVVRTYPTRGFARNKTDPSKWDYIADEKHGIAVVRISAFNRDTDKEVKAAVLEAEKLGARALVLDLRDNGGGLLDQAIAISDLFLNDGVILSTSDRTGGGRVWKAKSGDTIFEPASKRPIAVLVNGNSASASEILAAALAENDRAVVVGERSFGKGSVQKLLPLSNNKDHIKLTTEMWYTPKGRYINRNKDTQTDWGVSPKPELTVKLSPEEVRQFQLHIAAMDYARSKNESKGNGIQKALAQLDPNFKDRVLEKAMEYLRARLKKSE